MNLKTFLTAIDNVCLEVNKDVLHFFIRELARDLPEEDRDDFYKKLVTAKIEASKTSKKIDPEILSILNNCIENTAKTEDKKVEDELSEEVDELVEYFSTLDPKKSYLDSEYNEEYDYYHHDELDDGEYIFTDHNDLLGHINTACDVVLQCYEYELFEKGWPLLRQLLDLEIPIKGELSKDEGVNHLHLWDLPDYEVTPYKDISEVMADALPFIYFNYDKENRIKVTMSMLLGSNSSILFDFSSLNNFKNIDKKEKDDFYKSLIQELISQKSYSADSCIEDLVDNISSPELLVLEAKKYLETYPSIMKRYITTSVDKITSSSNIKDKQKQNEKFASLFPLLLESITKIPSNFGEKEYLIEIGIFIARKLRRQENLENLCLELFSLRTNPVNYLKLRYYSDDYHKYDAKIQNIYETAYVNSGKDVSGNGYLRDNLRPYYASQFSLHGYHLMRMLDGRAYEFFYCVKCDIDCQNFKDTLPYTGLLLSYLLLAKKGYSKRAYGYILVALTDLFINIPNYESRLSFKYKQAVGNLPSSEDLLKLWLEQTSIKNNFDEELLSIVDVNLMTLIKQVLTSKRTSLYSDVICWVVMLFDLYKIYKLDNKRAKLIDYIITNHSGKKAFLKRLEEAGIALIK